MARDQTPLAQGSEYVAQKVKERVGSGKRITVVSHHDADGITSASIVAEAILRLGGRFATRIYPDLNPKVLKVLHEEGHDFLIFCDLGAGMGKELEKLFTDSWISIDHHELSEYELELQGFLNAWRYGIDGGREVSSSGMAYLLATKIHGMNRGLAGLAVVGALGDRQDVGAHRSLIGLNERIAEEGISKGVLKVRDDLLLQGRSSRPLYEALALLDTARLPGLSRNQDACLALLSSAKIEVRRGERWRTLADLAEEEKVRLIEALLPHLPPAKDGDEALSGLVGKAYLLEEEDEHSPLYDAREFATLMNSCGRMKGAGIGISICLGDRGKALRDAESVMVRYRQALSSSIDALLSEEGRVRNAGPLVLLRGDGLFDEDLLGAVSSILSATPSFSGKVVLARTVTTDGDIKFSGRASQNTAVDLGRLMRESAERAGGVGGGHMGAAGARVPRDRAEEFVDGVLGGVRASLEGRG